MESNKDILKKTSGIKAGEAKGQSNLILEPHTVYVNSFSRVNESLSVDPFRPLTPGTVSNLQRKDAQHR